MFASHAKDGSWKSTGHVKILLYFSPAIDSVITFLKDCFNLKKKQVQELSLIAVFPSITVCVILRKWTFWPRKIEISKQLLMWLIRIALSKFQPSITILKKNDFEICKNWLFDLEKIWIFFFKKQTFFLHSF